MWEIINSSLLCVDACCVGISSSRLAGTEHSQVRPRAAAAAVGGAGGHTTQLPLARVKLIIKTDPDTTLASQEAVLLVTKATELFISHLARQAHQFTLQGKRKTLQRRDIDACLPLRDELFFLEGALDT